MFKGYLGHHLLYHRNNATTLPTNVEDQVELDEDGDRFYEYSSNISSLKSNLMDSLKISQDYLVATLTSLLTFKYYSNESLTLKVS
ncbi:unnamed protein product [Rotaria sp. Silwood1]|nr:unnamed protein product [Rotaria sp. Silwood1]CAF1631151.1 unnamed protein product [Rotaria sp. Silwood1]